MLSHCCHGSKRGQQWSYSCHGFNIHHIGAMDQKENVQFQMSLLLSETHEEVDNDSDIVKNCDHELRSLLRIEKSGLKSWYLTLQTIINGDNDKEYQ